MISQKPKYLGSSITFIKAKKVQITPMWFQNAPQNRRAKEAKLSLVLS